MALGSEVTGRWFGPESRGLINSSGAFKEIGFFKVICMCPCIGRCICEHGTDGVQKRATDLLELELQTVVSCPMGVLGNGFPQRAVRSLSQLSRPQLLLLYSACGSKREMRSAIWEEQSWVCPCRYLSLDFQPAGPEKSTSMVGKPQSWSFVTETLARLRLKEYINRSICFLLK